MTAAVTLPESIRVVERGWLSSNNILGFDGDEAALIDSGYAGQAERTVDLVRAALGGRRLTRLINTHSHSDHIGGNAALQREFGCAVTIPAGIAERVAAWDETALLLTWAAQRADRFSHDATLRDGERFGFGGMEWRAYAAPGHDMDALVYYCPAQRLLVSGDALWEDGFGIVFAQLLGQGDGLAATRETLTLLAGLDVDIVLPGHGRPFGDYAGALHRANKRLAAFVDDPVRVVRNAAKAGLTFNLLDLGRLPLDELEPYVARVPLFRQVGGLLGLEPAPLAQWLLVELRKAGAVCIEDGAIVPTMAA